MNLLMEFRLKMKRGLIIFLFVVFGRQVLAQEFDITQYLQEIDAGGAAKVAKLLPSLKKAHPNDPSVLFLDAVLTTNGEEAFQKYYKIYSEYPHSAYADAALYRIFSFYFSMGLYVKAKKYLQKLKKEYPSSPYIKYANRNIPEEELGKVVLFENNKLVQKQKSDKQNPGSEKKIKPKRTIPKTVVNYFAVQAGAFLNYDNAKNLSRKFKGIGWTTLIYPKEVGGALLNVVLVGKFKTRREAERRLKKLKSTFGIRGRIIKIKNK